MVINNPVSCKTTNATQKTHQLHMLTHKNTLKAPKCGFIAQKLSQTANSGENVKTHARILVVNPPVSCKTTTSTQKFPQLQIRYHQKALNSLKREFIASIYHKRLIHVKIQRHMHALWS